MVFHWNVELGIQRGCAAIKTDSRINIQNSISLPQAICIFFLPPLPSIVFHSRANFSLQASLCSAAARQGKGLVQAKQVGFREQNRAWFQHLIQFVLPRLKYEMLASHTFKSTRGWGKGGGEKEENREPSEVYIFMKINLTLWFLSHPPFKHSFELFFLHLFSVFL